MYFPRIHNNFEIQKNKIQLYCNQVFVTDEVQGIVPEYLTLLHGVIDSPDIPLNVSRSYLQSDSNVKKISGYITRKVAERLNELFSTMRAEYEQKWDDLKIFIEYGILTDEKFAEKAAQCMLLYGMKYNDIVDMYTKYGGDWGETSPVYRFDAEIDGKVVKSVTKVPMSKGKLNVNVYNSILTEAETYDVGAIRVSAVDEHGNLLYFSSEPIRVSTEGPLEIIGPDTVSLRGGMTGIYVKTTGESF